MKSIVIRDATGDDVYAIRNVQKVGWLATYPNEHFGITREDILEHFNDTGEEFIKRMEERKKTTNTSPNTHTWVAVIEQKEVIGFCIARKGEENRVASLYVLPSYHGNGIGKMLMKEALQWIGENKKIWIGVASYNNHAISFYEKFGFHKANIVPHDCVTPLPSGKAIPEIEMSNQ